MTNQFQNWSFRTARFGTAIWAAKLLLLSTGIASTLMFFKVALIPFIINLSVSTLPRLWISLRGWLSPPYIYLIVNFIIITIAASSAFQHQKHHPSSSPTDAKPTATHQPQHGDQTKSFQDINSKHESMKGNNLNHSHETLWDYVLEEHEKQQVKATLTSNPLPEASPEDSCVTEAGEDKGRVDEDTLDATWEAIMEAQGKTKTQQLKKSETWDVPPRLARVEAKLNNVVDHGDPDQDDPVSWALKELKKSDTFSERVSLRGMDKSMSQDELNRRAEAFIKKIYDDMRLQRLESAQRMIEMVDGGTV